MEHTPLEASIDPLDGRMLLHSSKRVLAHLVGLRPAESKTQGTEVAIMAKDKATKVAQAKIMEASKLVGLVTGMLEASKGTPYVDGKGRARVNNGTRLNVLYPRGAALNDILRQHGFDPVASVQAAVKAGVLVTSPAGGHSIAVSLPGVVSTPVVADVGTKNMAVAESYFAVTTVKAGKSPLVGQASTPSTK